jgi:hypothetical protein
MEFGRFKLHPSVIIALIVGVTVYQVIKVALYALLN